MTRSRNLVRLFAALLAASAAFLPAAAREKENADRGRELFNPGHSHFGEVGQVEASRPPLYDGLGNLSMPVTTKSTKAQAYFDQGLRLTWGFNHAEARFSFQEAQRLDPECAMCFWGEAFVLGPNINDAMHDEAVKPAHQAVQRALALKERVTEKERALIDALATRYAPDGNVLRSSLDKSWADAMERTAQAYPDDVDILVFYADALMNLQPWDYWEKGGVTNKGAGSKLVAALERAVALDPRHIGAAHLYIHAVEASADPGRAEAVADRLRGATPAAGHLVHMPAHIYTRIGRHQDSIEVNRDAIAADEAFLAQAGERASPQVRHGYYPHNVHFLLISAQAAGVRADLIAAADKLAKVTSDEFSKKAAWVQAIKTAPYAAHAQFSDAEIILALPAPGEDFPFVKGFWHYARGVAFASRRDTEAADGERAVIDRIISDADLSKLEEQYLPAKDVLKIAKLVLQARIDQASQNYAAAEQSLREAIELQDGLPYMEPPYWYYPVRQTLGAVLLQQGRTNEAAAAFQAALKESPGNGWALWGLLQAQIAAGDGAARETKAALSKAWLGDESLLRLGRL
jgi:tetratricopeptide (TPR) repeat protein